MAIMDIELRLLSAEEQREVIERYEEERHRRVESPNFKRKVSSHVMTYKKYLDKKDATTELHLQIRMCTC